MSRFVSAVLTMVTVGHWRSPPPEYRRRPATAACGSRPPAVYSDQLRGLPGRGTWFATWPPPVTVPPRPCPTRIAAAFIGLNAGTRH